MRPSKGIMNGIWIVLATFLSTSIFAQQPQLQYYRPWNQNGINVFEPSKADDAGFDGFKVRIGGSFTQQFQALDHENEADPKLVEVNGKTIDLNQLYPLGSGFNLATANLNLDFQVEDGIRVALENYMSSRHHSEFWVKGGYIQIDKLPMFNNPEWFTKYLRVKIGHYQPNYGDVQFRRTDNGNAIYNPFVGNYIMDAFTTEIGGEVYVFPVNNVMAMVGVTAGLIGGDVNEYADPVKKNPSLYLKLAYDKQVSTDLRLRLSGSMVQNSGTPRNTLYAGDRTGSRFYLAMEPNFTSAGATTSTSSPHTSGRINPGFNNELTAFQVNPFVKWKGLEFFGTYEMATGKTNSEEDTRTFNQYGAELVYRFLKNEQLYIGGKYNMATGELAGIADEVTIDRIEVAAGWFPIKNLLLKVEYLQQNYQDFPSSDIRHEGTFNGFMIEAVVGL